METQPSSSDPLKITNVELHKAMLSLRGDISEIKTALIGNNLGNTGLFPRVTAVETKVDCHERRFIVWGTTITVLGIGLTFLKDVLVRFIFP